MSIINLNDKIKKNLLKLLKIDILNTLNVIFLAIFTMSKLIINFDNF